jgi:steroid 5-alpha reductase family enzyme
MLNIQTLWALIGIDLALMTVALIINQMTKRAGIVDVMWSFCILVNSVYCALLHQQGDEWTRLVIGMIGVLWFGRLGLHLLVRYYHESKEDGRYANMRAASGKLAFPVFVLFFIFQAGLAVLFSLPMWWLTQIPTSAWTQYHHLVLIGAGIWLLFALWGETTADRQLTQFRTIKQNRGKTMRTGLWAYSRHPNYFFEWLHWFVYPIIGIEAGLYGLWLYPILMFLFLYYVTGIPFTEKQALLSRGDDYRLYQQQTSLFFPRSPRK